MNHADFVEADKLLKKINQQPNKDNCNIDIIHEVAINLKTKAKSKLGCQQKKFLEIYDNIFLSKKTSNDLDCLNDVFFKNNRQQNITTERILPDTSFVALAYNQLYYI